jgi:hypothetical protein
MDKDRWREINGERSMDILSRREGYLSGSLSTHCGIYTDIEFEIEIDIEIEIETELV